MKSLRNAKKKEEGKGSVMIKRFSFFVSFELWEAANHENFASTTWPFKSPLFKGRIPIKEKGGF